jgi:hypothetical protein
MPFNKQDFEEHHENLRVIAYQKLRLDYFQAFRDLSKRNQRLVNEEINRYIKQLPNENYLDIITKLFNEICQDDIFDDNFQRKVAGIMVRKSTKQELEQDDETTQAAVQCFEETMEQCNISKLSKNISDNLENTNGSISD